MTGYPLLLQGMQNGGILLFTMSLPWLELVFLVFLMLCLNLDGMRTIFYFPYMSHNCSYIVPDKYSDIYMSTCFRGAGIAMVVGSWVITLYTIWQMVEMHECVPGRRFDRYHELGQAAFGEKLGLWIVVPQQLTVDVGTCIVYMVTGGKSLQKFHQSVCPNCTPIRTTFFIMIFGSSHFVLSFLPNFNSISAISLAASVMSLR